MATVDQIFRDYKTDGVPASGAHNPIKSEIRAWGLLLGRSKLINSTRVMTAASGNVAYTGVGFMPTSIHCLAGIPGITEWSVGLSDSSLANYAFGITATTPAVNVNSGHLVWLLDLTGANSQVAALASYDSDGFTLTWVKGGSPTGTATLYFLCSR